MKLALCLGLLAVAFAARSSHQQWESRPLRVSEQETFRAGKHYTFNYDGQIATGLPMPSSQHAASRVQAVVSLVFQNDRVALMKLQKIRVAAGQKDLVEPRNLQPFGLFEETEMTQEQQELMSLPFRFRYEHGLVSEIEFDEAEQPWSANFKRSILSMIQVNMQKKARTDEAEISRLLRDTNEQTEKDNDFFTTQETILEGDCETAYTMVPEQNEEGKRELSLSKSVSYDKCSRRVDIRYNFRFGEECPSCEKKFAGDEQNTESSTVYRYKIVGNQEEFLIREVELRSQYLFSPLDKAQQLMGTFVSGKLTLVKIDSEKEAIEEPKKTQQKQTIVYSTEWEENLEKFRMTGDEQLLKAAPYNWMSKKIEQARQIIKTLAKEIKEDQEGAGFQLEQNHQVARLVEVLRVSTKEEINKIAHEVTKQSEEEQKMQLREYFHDILAIAGTKTTIEVLSEKIAEREVSTMRAARLIKMIVTVRNPSEQIVDQLVRLCKEDSVERQPILKQSCWLTTGALLNGLCGDQRDRLAREVSFERKHNMCPRQTKQKYADMLEQLFERAQTRYEKVLSLKTIANAGFDLVVFPLEKIINDHRQEKTVRIQAIDALRQLRSVMPRKIQALLMPIYKNTQEQPEIRVAAFHQIMHTLPERAVLDQIAQQLEKEPSHQVATFVYSALKSYAKSEIPCERALAQDIEQSLRLARVQPRKVLDSTFLRATLYHDEYYTGAALNWASLFTNDSVLPKELTASMDTVLGGQWNKYAAQIGFAQQNIDQVLYKLIDRLEETESLDEVVVRGKRASPQKPSELLRQMMQKMGIKHRRQEKNTPAHAMIYIRFRDLDYAVLPIDEHTIPMIEKLVVRDGKVDLAEVERFLARGYRFNADGATFLHEVTRIIPTTLGAPLEITSKTPTVFSIQGEIKAEIEPKNGKQMDGLKLRIVAKPKIATTHVAHMELRSPVLSMGVKLLHSAQLNMPIDAAIEMNWAKKGLETKTTIKAPEQKQRIVLLHTRPVTYIRHENSEAKVIPTQEKTVFLPEQPRQPIENVYGEQPLGMRFAVNGNVHRHLLRGEIQPSHVIPALVSENHVEVVMEKGQDAPREYVIRTNVAAFDQESRMEKPEFDNFFEKNNEAVFETEDSQEQESERRVSFGKYAKNYKTEQNGYKHRVHVKAEAVGSSVERKAEMEIRSVCDETLTFCKWNVDASRTPLFQGERRQWELRASGQTIFPEPVESMKQLQQQKHREIQATVEAQWGAEEKNSVQMKLQAEQNKEAKQWQRTLIRKAEQQNEQKGSLEQTQKLSLASRLNQIKIVADYQLAPKTLVQAGRLHSLLQAWQPWNSQVEILSPVQYAKQGRLVAKMSVEPQTWRYANISVETPSERLTLRNVYVPVRPTYLSIEKSQPIRGFSQLGRQIASQAVCEVSSNKVNTFDDVVFRAPLTTCYSVLAKDCSNEQPKFAVLLKKIQQKGEEKKMKIITEENTIEIENKKDELVVKVDGKHIKESDFDKYGMELRGESMIVFENDDFKIRFDGYKAEIELSPRFKTQQCGICGHYDGERDNEFRMADNEETEDVELFHRSFLAKDEECEMNEDVLSKKDNYKIFEQSYEREEVSSSEEEDKDFYNGEKKTQKKNINKYDDETVEPEEKTQVIEYSHRICFSKQPVPICPSKTHESEETKEIKVKFACMPRSEPEARRLLRDSRREVLSIDHLPESFVETYSVPKTCVVY